MSEAVGTTLNGVPWVVLFAVAAAADVRVRGNGFDKDFGFFCFSQPVGKIEAQQNRNAKNTERIFMMSIPSIDQSLF